jgi:hypothetical protein
MSIDNFYIDLPNDGKYPIKLTPFPIITIPFSDTPEIKEYTDIYIQRADYWQNDTLGSLHSDFSDAELIEELETENLLGGLVRWKKTYSNAASWSSQNGQNGGQSRFTYEVISANYPAFVTWDLYHGLSYGGDFTGHFLAGTGRNLLVSATNKTVVARVRESFYNTTDPTSITLQSALKVVPQELWDLSDLPKEYDAAFIVPGILPKVIEEGTGYARFPFVGAINENELHEFSNPTKAQFLNSNYWKPLDDRLERVKGNLWLKREFLVRSGYPINNASAII